MSFYKKFPLFLFFLLVFCSPPIHLFAQEIQSDSNIYYFGVLAKRGESIEKNRFFKLKEYLNKKLPYKIEFLFLPFEELKKKGIEGSLHFILTNPFQAITLKELARKEGNFYKIILSLGQYQRGGYYPYFGGVIFTKKGSPINNLADLRNKTFGAVNPESFGGYLIALYELKKSGIREEDLKTKFYGTHDAVVMAVLKGEVEAGTVRTGILEDWIDSGKISPDTIKIVNQKLYPQFPLLISSTLYPEWPILALDSVPQEVIKSLAKALLDIEGESQLAKEIQAIFYLPLDYTPVDSLLLDLMKGPYGELKEIYFERFKEKFLPYFIVFLFFTALILSFLAYRLAKRNRELKITKENLEREKGFLDTVLKHTDYMIFYLNLEGKLLWANQKGERISLEKENLPYLWDICPTLKKLENFKKSFDKCIRENNSVNFVETIEIEDLEKTYEGELRPISMGKAPIGILFFFRDITDKIVLEKQKIYLEKLNVLKNVAGGLAHDFNNSLLGVMNQIELLRVKMGNRKLNAETKALFQRIQDSLLELRIMGRELLTLVRGEAPVKEKVDVSDLVRNYTALALSGKQNYTVEYKIESQLPAVALDKELFSILWLNLILNATEAMPGGGKILIEIKPLFKGEEVYLQLLVRDEGVGIPEKYKTKIFEPFFTTKPGGSGLGLYVVREVVKAHNGEIRIDSQEGKGTTVIIELPALKEEVFYTKLKSKGSKKILIMDDEDEIRETLKELLEYYNYEVVTAPNGERALELYYESVKEKSPFEYLLLDLIVPGKYNGFEVYQKIKEDNPEQKVILMSGYFDQPLLNNYKEYGVKGVLIKPFTIQQLLEQLE